MQAQQEHKRCSWLADLDLEPLAVIFSQQTLSLGACVGQVWVCWTGRTLACLLGYYLENEAKSLFFYFSAK